MIDGASAPTHPTACLVCQSLDSSDHQSVPQAKNRVTVSMALGAVKNDDSAYRDLLATHGHLVKMMHGEDQEPRGPGFYLHRLLHKLGIEIPAECHCHGYFAQMDAWTAPEEHKEEAIAFWDFEIKRRKWKLGEWGATDIVKTAFNTAKRNRENLP